LKTWAERKPSGKIVLGFLLAFVVLTVFGGNKGFLALVSMQREKWRLEKECVLITKSNDEIFAQCQRLERNPQMYEKVAREKLMLAKPGDLIYRFDGR
jgi:cell division protein FtsB